MIDLIADWPGAVWLQHNWVAYLFVNATHILGIGLILGAILPLDLRLLGLFKTVPVTVIAPFLSRAAAVGVGLAMVTGLWLFSVKPDEYLSNPAFLTKAGLLVFAVGNVAAQHRMPGFRRAVQGGAVSGSVKLFAAVSVVLWLSVLVAGRWIGFL
ncbi:putative membrane protein [Asticcacaulis biprosthecium C19]|uniref:Putative membrane protein n=1 Tax=Asticcacaulis biprosthecium C19 TaxID=715226 RepID=F4QTW9_9CAUL|nr:DUF6644 family protein [Asticcacaulis biprosthecium]EGF89269.1 putative membrane protein [Asticcacaulis biprosthecium C19]